MTVYVESNFVLEQACQQEQSESCDEIVQLASARRISLAIPAFSLAEPHGVIASKEAARFQLSNHLQSHLRELSRSKPYRELPDRVDALVLALAGSVEQERSRLQSVAETLLEVATIIPLDARILNTAPGLQRTMTLSGQDAMVLASVLAHLEENRPGLSCFLNRNTRNFGKLAIREKLDVFGCHLLGRFDDGLAYIRARI